MKLARALFPGVDDVFQGRYRIVAEIGSGGFGTVYRAVQLATGQQVAIKVLRLVGARDARVLEKRLARLEREMRLCAQLHHPNIVGLIDFGRADDGSVYSVFEFVPGKNLEEVLAEEGALDPVEARHLMLQVLDALACAHGQGVIHRDLKPSNIMVISTGARRNALVLDFGIGVVTDKVQGGEQSRLTATNEVLGTIAYASPEQLFSKPTSPSSDLYSWGLVFLECLTGAPAIQGASMMDALLKQVAATEVAMPPALHAHPLGRLLRSVVAKKPEERPATVQEVMKRLESCLVADLRRQDLAQAPAVPRPSDLLSQPPPPPASETLQVEQAPRAGAARQAADVPATLEAQAPAAYPMSGERRQVTAVCVMLSVLSPEGRSIDIEEADQLLYAGQETCARVAARFRGHPTGALGNQTIFWFGYPAADEDDARRAGRAALEMISEFEREPIPNGSGPKPRLEVRIGIHTGIVVSWPSSMPATHRLMASFGTTSNVAAQLCALAAPGAIVVSGATHRLLRLRFSFSALGAQTLGAHVLGGAAARVDTYRLEWPISITHAAGAEHQDGPMADRAHEMDLLLQRWEEVRGGRGQAVLVSGEAGIGKSRLVRELANRIRSVPHRWIECRSAPEDQNSALYPIIDMLERTLELGDEETPAGKLAKLKGLLQSLDFTLDEHVPLFSQLLGIPLNGNGKKNGHTRQEVAPQLFKEQLLNALVSLFFELAEREPVVLLAEDLQWTDPTTLELYSMIVQEASSARILVIFSARPAFTPPWKASDVLQLQLARLGREEVKEMVASLSGLSGPPSSGLIKQIVERTDGVPLFVEELTRMMAESGLFTDSSEGGRPSVRPSLAGAVPGTLRDLLTARLDRLGRAKGTAQIAAALGREFSFDVLAAVSPLGDPKLLQDDLDALVAADLVFRKRRAKGQSYAFKHGLVRDTAYESMLKRARQKVHGDIARVLTERFGDSPAARPDLLAVHLAEAGREREAVVQVVKAADTSVQRSAPAEAMGHAHQALAWLEALPPGPERDGLELHVQNVLITSLMTLKGLGAPDVRAAIQRAQALLDNVEDSQFTALLTARLGFYYQMRADLAESISLGKQCLAQAERAGDTAAQVAAHVLLSLSLLYSARFEESQSAALRALALYDPEEHGHYALLLGGFDFRAACYGALGFVAWFRGQPDRALEQAQRGVALMEQAGHANSIAAALLYLASVHSYRREPVALAETCRRLQEISQRHGLFLGAVAGLYLGALGGDAEGPKQIVGGLRAYGHQFGMPYWLSTIAETEAAKGQLDAALERIEDCIRTSEATGEVHYLPELIRLEGTFLTRRDGEAAVGAEACFRRALDLARSQKSPMCALRAATSLGSLLRASDRRDEARRELSAALEGVTEGSGLPDLQDARALLADLGG